MKKKKADIEIDVPKDEVSVSKSTVKYEGVSPITQTFGNGDLNLLKDKINEVIARG